MKRQVKPWGAFKRWTVTCAAGLPHEIIARSELEAGAQFILEWPRVAMANVELVA